MGWEGVQPQGHIWSSPASSGRPHIGALLPTCFSQRWVGGSQDTTSPRSEPLEETRTPESGLACRTGLMSLTSSTRILAHHLLVIMSDLSGHELVA